MGLKLEANSAEKLKKMGVKVVEGVDKSGFIKAAHADPGPARQGARAARGEDPRAGAQREVVERRIGLNGRWRAARAVARASRARGAGALKLRWSSTAIAI